MSPTDVTMGRPADMKVMNRFDLTTRLLAKLVQGEAVVAGIGMLRQRNLTIVVWDNNAYQITGSQPTATGSADLAAIARGAGITRSAWAADESRFERLVDDALAHDGPSLIAARIDAEPARATTERDPARIRERFMRGLGARQ